MKRSGMKQSQRKNNSILLLIIIYYISIMVRGGSVYIMTNKMNTTLYTGVTSELSTRVLQHKQKTHPKSFTARYNLTKLVYFEDFDYIEEAIAREKQIKAGSRAKKIALIDSQNPMWEDLYNDIKDDW
jgi:putative endonuclease